MANFTAKNYPRQKSCQGPGVKASSSQVKQVKKLKVRGKSRSLSHDKKAKVKMKKVKVTDSLSTEKEPQVKSKCAVGAKYPQTVK
jgi:hypothetical protein